ncbi:MAG TPA: phosphatidylserine decarboxylase family protein [Candidatus Binatia bacterium]|jgi:phosphatidylserine decarboxylase
MKIAREGYPYIVALALLTVMLAVLGLAWTAAVSGLVTFCVAAFFRDPDRNPPAGEALILSPADGRLMEIRETKGNGAAEPGTRISIFMSPLDVHVNRSPVRCSVEDVEYRKGRFIAAYKESSSENNEQNALTMVDSRGRRLRVVQIAGVVARRIVCKVKKGDVLEAGQRFGIIMFGSRVDVFLPLGAGREVSEGQRVKGGETILARFDHSINQGSPSRG